MHPGRDNTKDHRVSGDILSTVSDVDIPDLAIAFPVESNRRGEKQVQGARLDLSGRDESRGDDVQAHGNNNNNYHGGGRKLVGVSEQVQTKTWRSLPLPEKQEVLHKLSQRIAMRQKISAKVFQKCKLLSLSPSRRWSRGRGKKK